MRLHVVGDLHLHVVAGHGLVDGEQLQLVEVVLAQLGFDALLVPVRRDRGDPVKGAQLRLQRRGGIEAAHRVDAAHELGRRDHLQVGARGQREQVLFLHEGAGLVQVLAGVVHVRFAGGVALGDFGQDFADDGVLACASPVSSAWSLWAGQICACSGSASSSMRARTAVQIALGVLEHGVGFDAAFQDVAEFARVELLPEPPVDSCRAPIRLFFRNFWNLFMASSAGRAARA